MVHTYLYFCLVGASFQHDKSRWWHKLFTSLSTYRISCFCTWDGWKDTRIMESRWLYSLSHQNILDLRLLIHGLIPGDFKQMIGGCISHLCRIKILMTDVLKPILPVWVRLGWGSQSSENCSCNSVYCVQKRGRNSAVHYEWLNECEVTQVTWAEGEAQKMLILGIYPSSQLTSVPPSAPLKNLRILTNVNSLISLGDNVKGGHVRYHLGRESSCKCTLIL